MTQDEAGPTIDGEEPIRSTGPDGTVRGPGQRDLLRRPGLAHEWEEPEGAAAADIPGGPSPEAPLVGDPVAALGLAREPSHEGCGVSIHGAGPAGPSAMVCVAPEGPSTVPTGRHTAGGRSRHDLAHRRSPGRPGRARGSRAGGSVGRAGARGRDGDPTLHEAPPSRRRERIEKAGHVGLRDAGGVAAPGGDDRLSRVRVRGPGGHRPSPRRHPARAPLRMGEGDDRPARRGRGSRRRAGPPDEGPPAGTPPALPGDGCAGSRRGGRGAAPPDQARGDVGRRGRDGGRRPASVPVGWLRRPPRSARP